MSLYNLTLHNLNPEQVAEFVSLYQGNCYQPLVIKTLDEPQEVIVHENVPEGGGHAAVGEGPSRTLIEHILHHACREGGINRKELKNIAVQYGFNVGSVSPTLVKLMKARRLKRIGKGVYATRLWRKAQ